MTIVRGQWLLNLLS